MNLIKYLIIDLSGRIKNDYILISNNNYLFYPTYFSRHITASD